MENTHSNPNKIIVALSGGVDSSVSAHLLKQQGYEVEALFMKNWEEDDTETHCSAKADIEDCERVCEALKIPFHTVNFAAEYWDDVFEHFLAEYKAGRTPNPDILCNKHIKFKAFLNYAKALGAEAMATGHYVRRQEVESGQENSRAQLLRGLDPNKDQSYFLYTLNQAQLQFSYFPVGDHQKTAVRDIAEQLGLVTHNKKDSTGICFIGERRFKEFLQTYIPAQPGLMKTPEGQVVGEHEGLMYYTLGQRQGLGIGGQKGREETPWYVLAKEVSNNELIVGQGHNHPLLFSSTLLCGQLHWVSGEAPGSEEGEAFSAQAKTRYRQPAQDCVVQKQGEDKYLVTFKQPQRAITPGQSVVFYEGEVCLGGGVII